MARLHKRMGEAVARVARKVNDTVENKTDSLGKAGSPSRLRLGPGQGSGIREQGSIFHCHRLKKAVGVPSPRLWRRERLPQRALSPPKLEIIPRDVSPP